MNPDIEKQINQLNQKLRSVFEEQDRNQSAIQTQERTEVDFHEWKSRSNRLFNRILETWYGDKELSHFFMNMRQEAQHIERKLTFELENQKETLLKEKRDLGDLENDLSYQQQQLAREANA
ncbi:hypothetical protein COM13_30280 [Bacillus pseudomycoides]|uniref:DUF3958 family protein n=4 Tax=Bacillus pseudomycoides TaxID=64104 RepID=UPI000BECFEFA|nr:DUF3958 family protein [Bacillus pseudomycoides]PDZ08454.1 hypothetical protein CON70_27700 [Bacillus pseudomycoides]PEP70748.1 hypothetical protein CN584_30985 [Bacillus pseudomycoides]PGB75890.1 hypothetical protein COM13_30280 [Bacillus pseudomycoides]PGC26498.1 hypothetical protein COM18_31015 [Bacillus pseudomycoides]PHB28089.1 hypothetical protein COE80_11950 [Bacillus pseudomycoides]